jgi:hypothetical protein
MQCLRAVVMLLTESCLQFLASPTINFSSYSVPFRIQGIIEDSGPIYNSKRVCDFWKHGTFKETAVLI